MTLLERRFALYHELDELIERCQHEKLPLEETLRGVLPLLRRRVEARYLRLHTRDEDLELRHFMDGDDDEATRRLEVELDVAGTRIGLLEAYFSEAHAAPDSDTLALLETGAEVLDNYLSMIQVAREKQSLARRLNKDLLDPLVDVAIGRAATRLHEAVGFDLMVVLYHPSDAYSETVRCLVFRGPELVFDTEAHATNELESFIRQRHLSRAGSTVLLGRVRRHLESSIRRLRKGETEELISKLGDQGCIEQLLNSGLRGDRKLGKIVVTGPRAFSTYERDVVALFADALEKRVIDFDRETRLLSANFDPRTVMRVLKSADYTAALLAPKRHHAAVLFTDISGFTRISEQVLGDASKISRFIQVWADHVVELLWRHGGTCDKFVGDCLIGLFGPPFFEQGGPAMCRAALDCARDIAAFTHSFSTSEAWLEIHPEPIEMGVATGVNYCPVSVGLFGPNVGYTAFSTGMNNTARLQGQASRHEILVMDSLVDELADDPRYTFGERREARVKNVGAPLRFHALAPAMTADRPGDSAARTDGGG